MVSFTQARMTSLGVAWCSFGETRLLGMAMGRRLLAITTPPYTKRRGMLAKPLTFVECRGNSAKPLRETCIGLSIRIPDGNTQSSPFPGKRQRLRCVCYI
jgi:hypothetical protein